MDLETRQRANLSIHLAGFPDAQNAATYNETNLAGDPMTTPRCPICGKIADGYSGIYCGAHEEPLVDEAYWEIEPQTEIESWDMSDIDDPYF